ncbi:AAA family ATPase [Butyribacter intestini]|uniref:AAA family ATPase n=1 Tax=Butyribacter intestini TaxID=1703332 RepID=UPI003AF19F53
MRKVSIGKQDYESLIKSGCFYVDKTYFIKEWWESQDDVTLITRPRRFGKTLNMSMLECFFSNKYAGRSDLFEGLSIWNDEKYRQLQGTYPVIFISFAEIKANNFKDTKNDMVSVINDVYKQHSYLLEDDMLTDAERNLFRQLDDYSNNTNVNKDISNETIYRAVKNLAAILYRKFEKKVIILLDEYDTPMQEAYVNGYWNELVDFIRSLFNSTFKTNPYLERAVMTGITRISKESIFSDLNNLNVITTTNDEYNTSFGFTENEVFAALDEAGLSEKKDDVKLWYDGFTFGKHKDIYNPWSITNYLDKKEFKTYWADTSSNSLVGKLIQRGSPKIKKAMEKLLNGEYITVGIDEQIVFDQLDNDEDAIWSLLLASGYLKVDSMDICVSTGEQKYELSLTNLEVRVMFQKLIKGWFMTGDDSSNEFISALIDGDLEAMNYYINEITLNGFSSFDVAGKDESRIRPENFYHGFVLGLMAGQRNTYIIKSNRESGFGRYDVMMIPKQSTSESGKKLPAIVLEFKVKRDSEKSLEEAVEAALKQIEEKRYDEEILALGIEKERIRHYGFAFEGKKVLIG